MSNNKSIACVIFVFLALFAAGVSLVMFAPKKDADSIAAARSAGVLTAEEVNIAFEKVSAKLEKRLVKESDIVKKGDILMILDNTDNTLSIQKTQAQIAQNAASIESANALIESTENDYQRAKELKKIGAVSGSSYDSAKSAYISAKASLKQLQAERQSLQITLEELLVERDRLTLRAPEDGKILNLMFQEGEIVPAGSPAVLLESRRQYYDIYVGENSLETFKPTNRVVGTSTALKCEVEGTVRFVIAAPSFADLRMAREQGTSDLTSFQVRIYLDQDKMPKDLIPGMTIEVGRHD